MKHSIFSILLSLSLFSIAAPARADFTGVVVSVGDGDTLTVKGPAQQNMTVRLACIDAPERAQAPWGEAARTQLKSLVTADKMVTVREIEKDRYGRTVGELFLGGKSINLSMVQSGHAVVYQQYLNACAGTKQQYLKAEANAKQNKLAFWSQACLILPWDFRAGKTTCATPVQKTRISYVPGTCKALKAQGIRGPFYRDQGDLNYTPARDRDRDGIACE
jgi:micrococcal nuclease